MAKATAEETQVDESTTEETPAKRARAKKPALFSVGDKVITPMGEADVVEVHGRGWVKVDGVPKAWHKIADLEELNPDAVAKLAAALEELEKAKAARADGSAGKLAKLQTRLEKAVTRRDALNTTITELEGQIAEFGGNGSGTAE